GMVHVHGRDRLHRKTIIQTHMIEPKLEVRDDVITATLLKNKGVDARSASQPVIPLPPEQEVDAVAAIKRVGPVLAIQHICAIAAEDRLGAVSTTHGRV